MIRKILLAPIYTVLLILRIGINIMLQISSWVFYLLGGLLLLATVCCYYMQIESAEGLRSMIVGSGIFLIIPVGASMLSGVIEVAEEIVRDRMRSA